MELVYKHEKTLFGIAFGISLLFWIALVGGTLGIALIYLLFGWLFFLFAQSAFITHIKGTGVKITESQYPDLHESLMRSCKTVGLEQVPDAYLLRTDFFNALATKFLRKHFIVLYTDVVDALEDKPGAIDFYIGHELGHIHRGHLTWNIFVAPACILPLLGAALRRAEEYTCDRYGAACCSSEEDVVAAIAAIAAGDTRWKTLDLKSYTDQISETSGFWMSFNELVSDYPWLTKRMATALAAKNGQDLSHPKRHFFAWLLAVFIPRFGAGGGGAVSILMTIAIIGILAAVAIPQYSLYIERTRLTSSYMEMLPVKDKVTQYAESNQQWPASLTDLGYSAESIENEEQNFSISIYDNGVVAAKVGVDQKGEDQYLVLQPNVTEGEISWGCFGQNIDEKNLPPDCQE